MLDNLTCKCIPWGAYKQNDNVHALLVWKREPCRPNEQSDNGYIFRLDVNGSTYSCLRGEAYVFGSSEYVFHYGSGVIGTVWNTRQAEVVDIDTTHLGRFFRRDLARMHGIHTVTVAWVDECTILETAVSKHIRQMHIQDRHRTPD